MSENTYLNPLENLSVDKDMEEIIILLSNIDTNIYESYIELIQGINNVTDIDNRKQ